MLTAAFQAVWCKPPHLAAREPRRLLRLIFLMRKKRADWALVQHLGCSQCQLGNKPMQEHLFDHLLKPTVAPPAGALLRPRAVQNLDTNLLALLDRVQSASPFGNMIPQGRHMMYVAMADHASSQPNACMMNQYLSGSWLSLHHDRKDPAAKYTLEHGDVVARSDLSQFCFHGVITQKKGEHPLPGTQRISLTFREEI